MNTRWHDLTVNRLPDGGIRLEQHDGVDDPSVIHLHPQQLRHVAEQFGLVAPNYPDDELSKKLAKQLCSVFLAMADDYHHLSRKLGDVFSKLEGIVECLPDAVFPHDLWDQREAREKAEETKMRDELKELLMK